MKNISVSIPGKCILFGEHAVVYGYPAIATAISLYSTCQIQEIASPIIRLQLKNYNVDYEGDDLYEIAPLLKASHPQLLLGLELLSQNHNLSYKHISITLSSDLWPSSGLGSSASISISLISCLAKYFELSYSNDKISDIAFQMEKIVHGNPSGIDNSICLYGGILFYKQKNIEFLPNPSNFSLLVIYSGEIHNTKKAIQRVQFLNQKYPKKIEKTFNKIGTLSEKAIDFIRKDKISSIFPLVEKNQTYLEELNLSTKKIKDIINIAHTNSFNHIKITGAGMGGCLIALDTKERLLQLQKIMKKNHIPSQLCSVSHT